MVFGAASRPGHLAPRGLIGLVIAITETVIIAILCRNFIVPGGERAAPRRRDHWNGDFGSNAPLGGFQVPGFFRPRKRPHETRLCGFKNGIGTPRAFPLLRRERSRTSTESVAVRAIGRCGDGDLSWRLQGREGGAR